MLLSRKTRTLKSTELSDISFEAFDNLDKFVNANDSNYSSIKLSDSIELKPNSVLEDEFNSEFWSHAKETNNLFFEAHSFYKFKDCYINPKHGIIVLDKNSYLHESNRYTGQKKIFGFPRDKSERFLKIKASSIRDAKIINHPIVYSFSTSPGFNYCHYNLDILSGIIPLLDHIKSGKIKLLWGHKLSSYHLELLQIVGLDKSHMIIDKSELIKCHYIIKSSSNFHLYKKYLSSSVLSYFNEVKKRIDLKDGENSKFPSRLLITRSKKTSKRQNEWTNFKELKDLLVNEMDFTAIDPGTLSINEQIKLFNSADIIIAQHGAALTNTAYCKEATTVIELLPDRRVTKLFYTVSKIANATHYVVLSPSTRIKPGSTINSFQYSIPIQPIRKLLQLMIK